MSARSTASQQGGSGLAPLSALVNPLFIETSEGFNQQLAVSVAERYVIRRSSQVSSSSGEEDAPVAVDTDGPPALLSDDSDDGPPGLVNDTGGESAFSRLFAGAYLGRLEGLFPGAAINTGSVAVAVDTDGPPALLSDDDSDDGPPGLVNDTDAESAFSRLFAGAYLGRLEGLFPGASTGTRSNRRLHRLKTLRATHGPAYLTQWSSKREASINAFVYPSGEALNLASIIQRRLSSTADSTLAKLGGLLRGNDDAHDSLDALDVAPIYNYSKPLDYDVLVGDLNQAASPKRVPLLIKAVAIAATVVVVGGSIGGCMLGALLRSYHSHAASLPLSEQPLSSLVSSAQISSEAPADQADANTDSHTASSASASIPWWQPLRKIKRKIVQVDSALRNALNAAGNAARAMLPKTAGIGNFETLLRAVI